jgi:hypothetical protein
MLQEELQPHYPAWKLTIDPNEIYPALGWYRTSPHADVVRWEATIRLNGAPIGSVESWHTMTECIKGLKVKLPKGPGFGSGDWEAAPR